MKSEKIIMIIWAILAVASFALSFSCPVVPQVVGIVFGCLNLTMIAGLILDSLRERKEKNNSKEKTE